MTDTVPTYSFRLNRTFVLILVFGAELIGLALAYQFLANIECRNTSATFACDLLRGMVLRALVVLGVAALLIRAWPRAFDEFIESARTHRNRSAFAVHVVGLLLMLVPLVLFWGQDLGAVFQIAIWPWLIGAGLGLAGGLLWLAPLDAFVRLLWIRARSAIPILLTAAIVPDIVTQVQPLWDWQRLASLTFNAVGLLLLSLGFDVGIEPQNYVIGIEDFYVSVAPQCSGVEGFALVAVFLAIYAFIFRSDVRLGRLFLILLPLGLLLSWILNIVRISLLIVIGAKISPDIAVNGFHSYAGWLMFTCLAFGLIVVAQNAAWLHREGLRAPAAPLPIRQDLVAAQLLPFAAFMVTGTLVAALFPHPGVGMPLVTVVLGSVLALFLPVLGRLEWQPNALSLGSGLAVGVGWVLTAPVADPRLSGILDELPFWLLSAWIVARLVGTVILVPIVEELFFRGYLMARLDGPGRGRRVLAVAVSSLAFAALHGRWVEAAIAGAVFALVMLHRGRVADAIWSHVVANGFVAGMALWRGDWSLI
jgi:hypothetical protein